MLALIRVETVCRHSLEWLFQICEITRVKMCGNTMVSLKKFDGELKA